MWLLTGGLHELKGSEYLLDGYITVGEAKKMSIGGSDYFYQYFQGEHEDEYTIKKVARFAFLKMVFLEWYMRRTVKKFK